MLQEAQLQRGIIFGDINTHEYVYMPASEIGLDVPLYVYEKENSRSDVGLSEALTLIRTRSLKPTIHPLLGKTSL